MVFSKTQATQFLTSTSWWNSRTTKSRFKKTSLMSQAIGSCQAAETLRSQSEATSWQSTARGSSTTSGATATIRFWMSKSLKTSSGERTLNFQSRISSNLTRGSCSSGRRIPHRRRLSSQASAWKVVVWTTLWLMLKLKSSWMLSNKLRICFSLMQSRVRTSRYKTYSKWTHRLL